MTNPKEISVRPFDKDAVPKLYPLAESESQFLKQANVLDIEIGCGVGWHPISYAQLHPNRCLVAIEHTAEKFSKFESRFKRHELPNLLPIHANAISWITTHISQLSVDRFLLLYPNPNPKDRARRWFCMPFMHHLLGRLKVGGEIIIASNEDFYIREVEEYATKVWSLLLKEKKNISIGRTHFEKKYLERGETCVELTFIKNY